MHKDKVVYLFIGLPWRVMNSEVNIDGIIDSSILLDVLKVIIQMHY